MKPLEGDFRVKSVADLLSVSRVKEPWTDQPTGEECHTRK